MDALILAACLGPLLLAALLPARATRRAGLALAPLAPLPALVLALSGADGLTLELSWLLFGSAFRLDAVGRLFLGFTAAVWLLAGWHARADLRDDPRRAGFWTFFLAAQAGNLGLILAADAVTFYTFYTLLTFAIWGLVVHRRDAEARRAGRVYLVMAMLGETALAAALIMASEAAGSIRIEAMAAAPPATAVALMLIGFGLKTGLPLLHMWLPLAHPVAPTPASAVLSGVILKAGLLGWLRFLPLGGEALPGFGAALALAGLAAMFLGVVAGLMQREIKVLLAYSSISQMGAMALGVGAGLMAPALWPALLPAIVLYALHHALAKSALFLGAGAVLTRGGRPWGLAGLALPALSLAGAPPAGGMLAKLELKAALAGLPAGWATSLIWLLPLAALGTSLLMARLLMLAAGTAGHGAGRAALAPVWLLAGLGALLPWWLAPAPDTQGILASTWPPLLAAVLVALALRLRLTAPNLPAGDLLIPLERFVAWLGRSAARLLAGRDGGGRPPAAPG